VRPPLWFDDVESLEASARTAKQHRTAAERLVGWAEEIHPDDDEVTPAALLCAAAWHLEQAGDRAAGLELYRRALDAPGDNAPDKRVYLHAALMHAGQVDAARALATEVRRSAPADAGVYELMGETYEMAGDLREALRWFAMGLARLDRDIDADDDWALEVLERGQARVREALGAPDGPDA
jgi:tetratricopeptide (TPR) repeat protein